MPVISDKARGLDSFPFTSFESLKTQGDKTNDVTLWGFWAANPDEALFQAVAGIWQLWPLSSLGLVSLPLNKHRHDYVNIVVYTYGADDPGA